MKIIKDIKEIDSLKVGEQYLIQPKGYDVQKPEKLNDFAKEIDLIQKAIEDKLAPKEVLQNNSFSNKIAIRTDAELLKMKEVDLIAYGKTIGADVDIKYSKAKNLESVKLKQ